MQANTIDEVIEQLEAIIQECLHDESSLGYFAVLYQKVTIAVKHKLGSNYFQDDERMERLDVVFANRYLAAYANYRAGKPSSACWIRAFDSSKKYEFIVLQHLLLGMNAHINLDLGMAAVEISTQDNIQSLQADFNKINEVLSSLVVEIQHDLCEIWPTLLWILRKLKSVDDFLVGFSMSIARDGAWKFANELVVIGNAQVRAAMVDERDAKIAIIANKITQHGFLIRLIFKVIRLSERGSVADKICALR